MARWIVMIWVAAPLFLAPNAHAQISHPCGQQLASYKGIPAYSNGVDQWTETDCIEPPDAYGDRYQCVEYARRFYALVFGLDTSGWRYYNADQYYGNATTLGLIGFPNGGAVPPLPDDIVVFEGGSAGHVAVVTNVDSGGMDVIEQNWSLSGTAHLIVDVNGIYTRPNSRYKILGWLRIPPVSTPSVITTIAGNGLPGYSGDGGPAVNAQVASPFGVASDTAGNVYIADTGNFVVRKVDTNGIITRIAGNGTQGISGDGGPAVNAQLIGPASVLVDAAGNLYIGDSFGFPNTTARIRKVDIHGIITTIAGGAVSLCAAATDNVGDGCPGTAATLSNPFGLAMDGSGNLYIADYYNSMVRKLSMNGVITSVAGNGINGYSGDNGPAINASLSTVAGVSYDLTTGNLYIADDDNNVIRKVSPGGIITTYAGTGRYGYAGDGGPAAGAQLAFPFSVAVDRSGNLYISDQDNKVIRKVIPSGIISTAVGGASSVCAKATDSVGDGCPPTSAILLFPFGIWTDALGDVYIADSQRVRKAAF